VLTTALLTSPVLYSQTDPKDAPMSVGPVVFRPSGFVEMAGVFRSSTTSDDVSTRFGAIPLGNQESQELLSIRHSRVNLKSEYDINGTFKISAYLESDFMNRATSDPFRWRQYWGKVEIGKWEVLAGRGWSLLRPNRAGINSETELMNTRVADAGYHVGLIGNRDRHFRVVRHEGNWHFALSYERGRDFVPKVAHDSKWLHFEVMGVKGAGGHVGGSVAAVVHATRKLDLVTQQFRARAGGRDALNALPAAATTLSTINGFEYRAPLGLQIYGYAGRVNGDYSTGNHTVGENSVGFSRQIWNGGAHGRTVLGIQLSHLSRRTWSNADGRQTLAIVSVRHNLGGL
jgi:hypothetical protein